ncbi:MULTISPECIES: TIGR03899 family protein [Pseudoalteromonas]|uniref:TIGR03899 family protein n=1 Tax=Pseudoalteromonas TaxID=53246 RepID=UPI0002E81E1C|nr:MULTISPECIES: TIGR03899 family protein [Pseudoalteromonas]MCG9768799.1 TIGR03899 family protein [Pseudoalteromonas piscicida]MDP4490406.1 TIGR03899 family protein [Pseudoalteromonas piscicida]QUI64866.1 TIGR03899 family protein [Pseudoalteromonas sp. A22]RXE85635.1 TIGR03899 family protein [Pseudoalteromonas sp. A757]RZG01645.1 TIGR03899 family protein [Pseudoalteromonas sp. CO348]
MAVKNAQVKSALALSIEEKLGYPMVKRITPLVTQNDRYQSDKNKDNQYTVRTEHGTLKRALKRQQLIKIQRQQNLEAIMGMALTLCPEVTARGRPDPDWLEHFITLAEDIANHSMQKLWAKILVGESITPGTFSIKSLQTLKMMTQREATALQRCAPLCGYLEKEDSYLILHGYYKKPSIFDLLRKGSTESINLSQAGLNFPNILTLMDINILYRQEIESASLQKGQSMQLVYLRKKMTLTAKSNDLVLSYYKLTQTGDELKKLLQSPINKQYKQLVEKAFESEFSLEWEDR